ncbi:MAG: hypothetical protein LRY73_05415 [Bacillus sp. (in: Bacteria)]|nr:hypothetical protein [Bacillus sp. (in: firmicutes)]
MPKEKEAIIQAFQVLTGVSTIKEIEGWIKDMWAVYNVKGLLEISTFKGCSLRQRFQFHL